MSQKTATFDDDPYSKLLAEDDNKLKTPEKESARARKLRLLRGKSQEMYANFSNGFLIGALVGGSFGTIIGLYTAVVNRSLLMLPLSAVISAASFGFFLGVGSMIRNQEEKIAINVVFRGEHGTQELALWKLRNRLVFEKDL